MESMIGRSPIAWDRNQRARAIKLSPFLFLVALFHRRTSNFPVAILRRNKIPCLTGARLPVVIYALRRGPQKGWGHGVDRERGRTMSKVFPLRVRASPGSNCFLIVLVGSLLGGWCAPARAQAIINQGQLIVGGRIDVLGGTVAGGDGFSVRKVAKDVAEAMEEFERYSGKGEWEKAFSVLPPVADSGATGLVSAGNGVFVPIRSRYRQLLVGLNPTGREAYRVFHDSAARQGLAGIADTERTQGSSLNEVTRLQELYDAYFITTIGDQIGDRLGDARFESGDFGGAADCWGAVLRDFPDSTLSPLRLNMKRAIALARAKRWEEFRAASAYIREKFPTEPVRLGGRDVPAATVLNELSATMPRVGTAPVVVSKPSPIRFPGSDEPLWQCIFADDTYLTEVDRMFRNSGMAGATLNPTMVSPRAIADDKRIYINWYGILMIIDQETGKLIWRSGPFNNLSSSLQQVVQLGFDSGTDQAIVPIPGTDKILLMSPSLTSRQVVQAGTGMIIRAGSQQIACYSTTEPKRLWASEQSGLATWMLLGMPVLEGEILYATGRSLTSTGTANAGMELSLLAIDPGSGRVLWTLPMGSMSVMSTVRNSATMPKPVLQVVRGILYVQTGNSAVVAVNLGARRVEWAYCWGKAAPEQTPGTVAPAPQRLVRPGAIEVMGSAVYQQIDPLQCPTSMAISEAGLFIKDRNSPTVHAIDLSGPSLKWSRPAELSSFIVGADANSVYLLGRQLDCIDAASKDLRWSSKTPGISGAVEPRMMGSHLYVYGARGLYDVDLATGDPKIFYGYDRDSYGGSILRVGNRLICVSNRSVTAYSLPPE